MTKWDYRIIGISSPETQSGVAELMARHGADGWELVTIDFARGWAYFKRVNREAMTQDEINRVRRQIWGPEVVREDDPLSAIEAKLRSLAGELRGENARTLRRCAAQIHGLQIDEDDVLSAVEPPCDCRNIQAVYVGKPCDELSVEDVTEVVRDECDCAKDDPLSAIETEESIC